MNPKGNGIRWIFLLFFTPVALWLLLLLILPHFELLRISFLKGESGAGMGVTWDNYLGFFDEPIYWTTFVRTALYSVVVTLIVLTVALPIAFYTTKIAGVKVQGFLLVLLLLPFWVSELIRVYGWMIIPGKAEFSAPSCSPWGCGRNRWSSFTTT
jgi:spermidine/putrescine transport system permease protein